MSMTPTKEVKALYDKEYQKKNKDKIKEWRDTFHKRNPNYQRDFVRKWRKEHPEVQKNAVLKRLYGISLEEYNKMFEVQQGKCAICGKHQTELKISLSVDHNHTTGKVRALLCPRCNIGLGFYENHKDSYERYLNCH